MPTRTRRPQLPANHQEQSYNLRLQNPRFWTYRRIAEQYFGGQYTYHQIHYAVIAEAQLRGLGVPASRSLTADAVAPRTTTGHQPRHNIGNGGGSRRTNGLPPRTAFDRRFGVEIEFTGCSKADAATALADAGLDVAVEGYNHHTRGYWKVIDDSSCGHELVSPILKGADGYEQVRKAARALRAAGARVNGSTGLHVHHEVRDLTHEGLARIVEAWDDNTANIDRLIVRARRGNRNSFCSNFHRGERDHFAASFRRGYPPNDQGLRFRSLNIMSFPRYGTFEIRQHQGTLNGTKIVQWVKFGQAFFHSVAVAEADLAEVDFDSFIDSLSTHADLTRRDATWFRRRAEALA